MARHDPDTKSGLSFQQINQRKAHGTSLGYDSDR
jgi:hypothetical protein